MLYPFISLPDGTEIVYSNIEKKDNKEYIVVKFERWNNERDDFDSMECELPNGKMVNIIGFTDKEVKYHNIRLINLQDIIFKWAKKDMEEEYANSY